MKHDFLSKYSFGYKMKHDFLSKYSFGYKMKHDFLSKQHSFMKESMICKSSLFLSKVAILC
jgi:hypothetical protein